MSGRPLFSSLRLDVSARGRPQRSVAKEDCRQYLSSSISIPSDKRQKRSIPWPGRMRENRRFPGSEVMTCGLRWRSGDNSRAVEPGETRSTTTQGGEPVVIASNSEATQTKGLSGNDRAIVIANEAKQPRGLHARLGLGCFAVARNDDLPGPVEHECLALAGSEIGEQNSAGRRPAPIMTTAIEKDARRAAGVHKAADQ